jgi:hypothetical protein
MYTVRIQRSIVVVFAITLNVDLNGIWSDTDLNFGKDFLKEYVELPQPIPN